MKTIGLYSMATWNSKLHRLYTVLVQPHSKIENDYNRERSVLLSAFQLGMLPFAVFTVLTADLVNTNIGLLIIGAISAILVVYLITRIVDYRNSVRLVVTAYTILPIIIWFSVTSWEAYDIPRILPYLIIALSIGALFTDERIVLVQGIVLSSILVYTAGIVHNAPFTEYDSYLLTVISSAFMVILFSRVINSYLQRLSRQALNLEKQKMELEIYTRLLRHDLSQMLIPVDSERLNRILSNLLVSP